MKEEELNSRELQNAAGGWYGSMEDKAVHKYCPKCGQVTVRNADTICLHCRSPLKDKPD